jgi:Ni/Fe-hydrogenase subunit HybB-like protein
LEDIVFGLAKGATLALFVYYFFQVLIFVHGHHWDYMTGGWGAWYITEVIGFVLIPCMLFAYAVRHRRLGMVRVAAVMTIVGIILNRLNVSVIAFNWDAPHHYVPSWQEIVVTLTVIFAEIWVFRWIVNRMPVISDRGRHAFYPAPELR